MKFEKAKQNDVQDVAQIYEALHHEYEKTINYPKWPQGIYPLYEDALNAFEKNELYVLKEHEKIIGSVILNQNQESGYETAFWQVNARDDEVLVIHTLAIDPLYKRKGYASCILNEIKLLARKLNYKALRLDITKDNLPARYLYQKNGFYFTGIADLHRQEAGIDYCEMFEYNLCKPLDSLEFLEKVIDDFLIERDWHKYHTADNLSKSIMIEAAELLECFQWDDDYDLHHVCEELADVMIYCFQLSAHLKVDVQKIIIDKMKKNEKKYPV